MSAGMFGNSTNLTTNPPQGAILLEKISPGRQTGLVDAAGELDERVLQPFVLEHLLHHSVRGVQRVLRTAAS